MRTGHVSKVLSCLTPDEPMGGKLLDPSPEGQSSLGHRKEHGQPSAGSRCLVRKDSNASCWGHSQLSEIKAVFYLAKIVTICWNESPSSRLTNCLQEDLCHGLQQGDCFIIVIVKSYPAKSENCGKESINLLCLWRKIVIATEYMNCKMP